MLVEVLKQCGDNLSRPNIMAQDTQLHALALPMLLPGITLNTTPTDLQPLKQLRMAKFHGQTWEIFGDPMQVSSSK
jgi:branched-chain amino acid transport system substrate-binding protein